MISPIQSVDIAIGNLKGFDWRWILRVDAIGLYRWYLNGGVETKIKGTTREAAESALGRFVERTLRGELQITAA